MAFADLVANLQLNTQQFSRALRAADSQYQSFTSRMTRWAQAHASQTEGLVENYQQVGNAMHYIGASARDVTRIFTGIIVAQSFYQIARSIRESVQAMWEFNESLDYARVTYSALMGSSSLAQGFLNELQQFSVETVFGFSELEGMSRKLLAYGIEYKNLMYIVQGLTNLGTLSGDAAALERLAVAIGQINAKGVLKAEEIRQLTNAYVPMYDILREQLGLSEEDLKKNIGDLGISSADAINAIIEYSNKRFGETATAAMYTITGLNQRIVDSVKVMGADMMEPVTNAYKSLTLYIAQQLEGIYEIYKGAGMGGVFEYLVPNQYAQQLIREFVANFINGIYKIVGIVHSAMPLITGFFSGFIQGANFAKALFNAFGSVVVAVLRSLGVHTPVLDILARALYVAGFAFAIFVSRAMAAFALRGLIAVFTGIARAVLLLTSVIIRNPIVLGLMAIVGVLGLLSYRANGANSAMSNLIKTLSSYSLGGTTADDILQPGAGSSDDAGAGGDYWDNMTDGANSAEDAIDSAGKAADKAAKKANKSLLAFDEVFRLNEPASSGSGAGGTGAADLSALEDLGAALGGLGGAMIPEIPSFKDFAKNFVGNLYNDLWESIRAIASGTVGGALIGGLVGFAIGGLVTKTMAGALGGAKLGAKIGAAVGGGFAAFWTDAYKKMEAAILGLASGGAVGALAGGLTGFIIGAFVTKSLAGGLTGAKMGAAIGSVVGAGLGTFWNTASEEMKNALKSAFAGLASASYAALIGALAGAIIGGFVGAMAGGIGAIPGAIAGAKLGGAIAGIGQAIYNIFEQSGAVEAVGKWFASLGDKVTKLWSSLWNIGNWISAWQLIKEWFNGLTADVFEWFAVKTGDVRDWWHDLWDFSRWSTGWDLITDWFITLKSDTLTWFNERITDVKSWWENLWTPSRWTTGWGRTSTWYETFRSSISSWFTGRNTDVTTWWSNWWIPSRWATGWSRTSTWYDALRTAISGWFTSRNPDIASWWSNWWSTSSWATGWSKTSGWYSALKTAISGWFSERKPDIKSWWSGWWSTSSWDSGWTKVKSWFTNLKNAIKDWFTGLKTSISGWWDNLWSGKTGTVKDEGGGILGSLKIGHATGGVFNREHIARFAEGNKAEAIIPLEERSAMQPFVDAVAGGLLQSLAPAMVSGNSGGYSSDLPPMYVGTLVADDRGLKELYKKFRVIQVQEDTRRGIE